MKKALFFMVLCLFLQGCATTGKYEKRLNSLSGHNISELVSSWGTPTGYISLPNGNMVYTWISGGGSVYQNYYNPYLNTNYGYSIPVGCKTTITTDRNGTISNWAYEGNSCRSY